MSQESQAGLSAVLKNRSFLFLWIAQALSQTSLNALVYTLLVRIQEDTGSTTALGLLILSFIVPSVVIGATAGVFVDWWQKKTVLLTTNLLRALIVVTFLALSGNFLLVLLVNLTFSIVSQFFAPAEIAAIPAVVPRNQLIVANGLFNLTMSGAQLMGFVIAGPILVKSLTGAAVFLVLASAYLLCSLLIWFMRLDEPERRHNGQDVGGRWFNTIVTELREGWGLLVRDNSISLSIMHLTLMNSLVLVIGMLAPGFVNKVLGIRADDAVFIMAPAGVGMLVGITFLPRLAGRWPKDLLANVGIFATATTLYLLGIVGKLGNALIPRGILNRLGLVGLPEEAGLVSIVMTLAFVLGIGYALVNVAAQTLVQERVPFDLRGRIFAAQLAFANTAAVLPLLFFGSLADLVGISEVTLFSATIVLLAGVFSTVQTQRLNAIRLQSE
ncbi:MAG: MFS transporter [Chloroflexi bacterium]|nr:MFS transporter [Chloroflexota bacterium]